MNEEKVKLQPYQENHAMTGEGENFSMPITYQGVVVYFGSLNKVTVPEDLQAELSGRLNQSIEAGSFPEIVTGDVHEGTVNVPVGDTKRAFRVVLSLQKNDRDDYFRVDSILEQE